MAVNSPFTKFIAAAASGDLTRALVKEGEQGSETLEGWLRILVVDTGEQLPQYHWELETVDTGVGFFLYSQIVLDSDGYPHIAYQDFSGGRDLKYAYKDEDGWHTETVDSADDVGQGCAIDLDANNYPHISYYDDTNDGLKYAYQDAGGWNIETVDSGDGDDVGSSSGIAIDSSGYPHIVYLNETDDDLEYAYKDAGGWNYEVAESATNCGWNCAIVLDGSDYPHVSCVGFTNGTADTRYAYKDGSGWHIETAGSDGDSNNVAGATVIRLDSGGYPHIVYAETIISLVFHAYYAYKDAGSWHTEVIDDSETGLIPYGFALDSDDLAHVSYYDAVNDDMKYAVRDAGGSWTKETVDSDGNVGHTASLALDSEGMAHIAYIDWTEYEVKYAKQAPGAYFYIPIYSLSS